MAKEKYIPEVIEAFLGIDKDEHEINYLITDYDPFTENVRDSTLQISREGRVNIAYKMEAARAIALKMNYDGIFNVEDDNLIPKDALLRLIDTDKSLVCGMYRYRISSRINTPLMPEKGSSRINFEDRDLNTGVREAFLIPWGCTLFKREVLAKIPFTPGLDGGYNKLCRESGISRWACTGLHVGHFDVASDGSKVEIKV